MKHLRFLGLLAVVALVALTVQAETPYTIQFSASACETNASAQTTYTPNADFPIHGYVDTIILDQTGSATGTVSIATLASQGTGPSRSVLLDTSVSADGVYPVRDLVCGQDGADIANEPARIPLVGDKLRLQLYNYGDTNHTVAVWVVIVPCD